MIDARYTNVKVKGQRVENIILELSTAGIITAIIHLVVAITPPPS